MKLLSSKDVLAIHESVVNDHELQGLAGNKSLDAIVTRVENLIHYGLIDDVFDLAASYGVVVAIGHAFNDANKRTAFTVMDVCLREIGITLNYRSQDIGQTMVKVSQGLIDETELARYLRSQFNE